jgi:DNA-binding response OmpR family regulator
MKPCTVLVVEDDPSIRRGLVDALKYAGYAVLEWAQANGAARFALDSNVDLVLLDVILPNSGPCDGYDGFSILAELRSARPTLPVIMVTARGAEKDRVRGLTHGADDYVIKPFSALELLARVEAVLRRSPARPASVNLLRNTCRVIRLARREVAFPDGSLRELTERETAILSYLAANRDRAVDRMELLQNIWGLDPKGIETRTVDMHIARLRERIGDDAGGAPAGDTPMILTVRGKGYKLAESVVTE